MTPRNDRSTLQPRSSLRGARLAAAALLAAVPIACSPDAPAATPAATAAPSQQAVSPGRFNVLLVTLDTTRADRLGCYGNTRIETPHLDALAAHGARLASAFTGIPTTLPSHASILTGRYPAALGIHDNALYELPASEDTLAESLAAAGWDTAAFVSAFVLDHRFGLDQGFSTYDDTVNLPYDARPAGVPDELPAEGRELVAAMSGAFQRRGGDTTDAALGWLASRAAGGDEATRKPWMLWVHYYDPHGPYQAPEPWTTRYDPDYTGPMDGDVRTFWAVHSKARRDRVPAADIEHMIARYDGEIAYADSCLGRILDALAASGEDARTLIVVTADHGESFGEHSQIWEHTSEIFDEAVHVPLIIRHPAGLGAGTAPDALVRTIDIAPTVLAALGLPPLPHADGISLLPLLAGSPPSPPEAVMLEAKRFAQVLREPHSYLGWRTDGHKLILGYGPDRRPAGASLYDLREDPGERTPLGPSGRALGDTLLRTLTALEAKIALPESALPLRATDAEDEEALHALGYVGGR